MNSRYNFFSNFQFDDDDDDDDDAKVLTMLPWKMLIFRLNPHIERSEDGSLRILLYKKLF